MSKVMSICLLFIIISSFVSGCQSSARSSASIVDKITIYKLKPNTTEIDSIVKTITDKVAIKFVVEAFDNAKKETGDVKMSYPQYMIEIGKDVYHLWLQDNAKRGTMLNLRDPHTIYTLSENATTKIREIISVK